MAYNEKQGEKLTPFIVRAINETMERDNHKQEWPPLSALRFQIGILPPDAARKIPGTVWPHIWFPTFREWFGSGYIATCGYALQSYISNRTFKRRNSLFSGSTPQYQFFTSLWGQPSLLRVVAAISFFPCKPDKSNSQGRQWVYRSGLRMKPDKDKN